MPLVPQQRTGRRAILCGGTFTIERTVKVLYCFLQLGGKTLHDRRIGCEHAKEIIGARLAIAEDREGVRIVSERLSVFI